MNTAALKTIKNRFLKYYLYRIGVQKNKIIMLSILAVLSYPLVATTLAFYNDKSDVYNYYLVASVIIASMALIITSFMSFIVAFASVDYLHDRTIVDMAYSLPISAKQRFWGDFLAGATVASVPYILSSVIGIVIYNFAYYNHQEIFGSVPPAHVFSYMVTGLVIILMVYILTIFVSMLCGSKVEAVIYSFMINAIIPAVLAIAASSIYVSVYGVNYGEIIQKLISTTSPIGLIIGTGINLVTFAYSGFPYAYIYSPQIFIPVIVFFGLLVAASYYLNKKRRAELVGMPFVYRFAYHVFMTLNIYIFVGLFVMGIYNTKQAEARTPIIIAMLVITFVDFVIFDVIKNRGFRKFQYTILRYAATVAGCYAVSWLIMSAEGFGMMEKIPEMDNISSVSINYDPMTKVYMSGSITVRTPDKSVDGDDEDVFYYYDYYYSKAPFSVNISDPNIIEAVRETQSRNIEQYKEEEEFYSNNDEFYISQQKGNFEYFNIEINYYLKSGGSLKRLYERVYADLYDDFSEIAKTEESKTAWADYFTRILKKPQTEVKIAVGEQNINAALGFGYKMFNDSSDKSNTIDGRKIADALSKDLIAEENPLDYDNNNVALLLIYDKFNNDFYYVRVKSTFTNTISVLNEMGYKLNGTAV